MQQGNDARNWRLTRGIRAWRAPCSAAMGLLLALTIAVMGIAPDPGVAEDTTHHAITPLKDAQFAQDDDVKCLKGALENGNPDTGPSTYLLKAPVGCRVPAHYHTAEEQLIVIQGAVSTGMKGMHDVTLTAGGIAVMPGKAIHWFSCTGTAPCLMAVTFDQKYDIAWVH
jgi:quercetin dioxygenase-like cupin family protein